MGYIATTKAQTSPANRCHSRKKHETDCLGHFTDTVFLILLELLLELLVRAIVPIIPEMRDILGYVEKFSKWFALGALVQFAVESSLELAKKDITRFRRIFRS